MDTLVCGLRKLKEVNDDYTRKKEKERKDLCTEELTSVGTDYI
jgi:hypothetical protein